MNDCDFCDMGSDNNHRPYCPEKYGRHEPYPKGESLGHLPPCISRVVYKLPDRKLALPSVKYWLFESNFFGFQTFGIDIAITEKGTLFPITFIYTAKHYCSLFKNKNLYGEVYTILDPEFIGITRESIAPADMIRIIAESGLLEKDLVKVKK